MAHLVETMAYAGQVPWHGLGTAVDGNMSPQEMLVAAGIDGQLVSVLLIQLINPTAWNIIDPTGEAGFIRAPDHISLCGIAITKCFRIAVMVMYLSKMLKLWTSLKSLLMLGR